MTSGVGFEVGRRLAALRLRRGLSQGSVARMSGVAASYISRIETGRVQPTFKTVQKLTRAMRVSLEELTGHSSAGDGTSGDCPVTRGACLIDLMRPNGAAGESADPGSFTPRQIKLLRRFADWIHDAPPDRQRAMEILIDELAAKRQRDVPPSPAPSRPK